MYDLIVMGRSGIDLYAQQVGLPFEEVESFAAYVGGSPANIVIGAQRLGLHCAFLTAVGDDPVGDFILHGLRREGVETRFIPRKPGRRSGAAVLAIQPPDRFPIVMYRDNCADLELDIDDVSVTPIRDSRVFAFAGTNLSGSPSREATLYALEQARAEGVDVVLDIDFRASQWHDTRAFGVAIRSALRLVDIAIGTRDEINAAALNDSVLARITHSQLSEAQVQGDTEAAIRILLSLGPKAVVEKRGAAGSRVHLRDGSRIEAPGFPVEILNTLGAGDAFAAGFIYGYIHEWDWYQSARLGNACGAIVVTRHGCSAFAPTCKEVMAFVEQRGGF
jgi:5-dehydro-2-deoxygluconokinase